MDARSSTSNSEQVSARDGRPIAALLALGIIIVIEILVSVLRPYYIGAFETVLSTKTEWLEDPTITDDVVIFGDSRYFSIQPEMVSEALGGGLTVRNYSWPHMGMDAYDVMLDAYLHYKPPPKYILMGMMPEFLIAPPERTSYQLSKELRDRLYAFVPTGALLPYLIHKGSPRLLWDYFGYLVLPPTARNRLHFKLIVQQTIQGNTPFTDGVRGQIYLEEMQKHGAFRYHTGEIVENPVEQYEGGLGPIRFKERPPAIKDVEHFFRRAEENGIQILLMNIQLPHSICLRVKMSDVEPQYKALLREWQAEFPNITIVGETLPCYPDRWFGDASHFNLIGDIRFHRYARRALERYAQTHPRE